MKKAVGALAIAVLSVLVGMAGAETVDVKYRGKVDLAPFDCKPIVRSSLIERVCYDHANAYMLVRLKGTYSYYHACGIDQATVDAFEGAPSIGTFFNASIKGHFDCHSGNAPAYR